MMTDVSGVETSDIHSEIEKNDSENAIDYSNATQKLACGLLSIYHPPLEEVKKELTELTNKQEALLGQMQAENRKLRETFEDVDLNEMFSTIKLYEGKLGTIKKDMVSIHERTFRLKKRALRLQQMKQKEVLIKKQQREQELRREQELIGKPSSH